MIDSAGIEPGSGMDDEYQNLVQHRLEPADITNTRTQVSMEDAHTPQTVSGWQAPGDKGDQTTVQAVDRAITLLETLAEAKHELRLQDIARMTDLKLSTCHHLLNTLLRRGYVAKLDRPRAYFLGPRISDIASMRGARFDLVREARPYLDRLAQETGATVRLAAFEGTELSTLFEQSGEAGGGGSISDAAHASALGKAILAWLPEPEIARVVADHGLPRLTGRTITSLGELVESLRQIRRHGFAVEDREFRDNEVAIACVIREKAGAVIGSVGASVSADKTDNERLLQLQLQISGVAREISAKCRL
ncbi:IclR family transcriptional regulator [Pseudooceanicola sp. C21-150M6]|uniref:IclR family transcriptional regulator n=1 Tax=Pseudooceanicola sp. C21-150M6 TaxID=3434355 RepID=UPI003D7F7DE5